MSIRGVWQLRKLLVSYCDWGGSSRGAREFVEKSLPQFQGRNPQLEIEQTVRRGHHPFLQAYYENGNERVVGIRNETPEQILLHANRLRDNIGKKVRKLKSRHISKSPSIQGTWTVEVQRALSDLPQ